MTVLEERDRRRIRAGVMNKAGQRRENKEHTFPITLE
jgi:hypothetical protein